MPPELKRAVQAAIAESNRYTDQKFADHIRENTVGGLLMAIAFFVALEVFNVLALAWFTAKG